MAIATLSIDFIAMLANLQAGLDKAGRLAEKNAAQIEAGYKRMSDSAMALGKALGGAFTVREIVQFVTATVDGVDKLNDLSDATGASVDAQAAEVAGDAGRAVLDLRAAMITERAQLLALQDYARQCAGGTP